MGAVTGIVELTDTVSRCYGPASVLRVIPANSERCQQFEQGFVDLGAALVDNPKETLYYMFLDDVYQEFEAGNYGEGVGRAIFRSVEIVAGAKGVAAGVRGATTAVRASRAVQAIQGSRVAQAIRTARGGRVGANRPITALARQELTSDDGFLLGYSEKTTLQPGTRIDRFGAETGRFSAPEGTAFGSRGLPPAASEGQYAVYEVLKPLDVSAGLTAPAFGQPG